MKNNGEIILYQPDNEVKLEVRLEDETVWLTQTQIVELFQFSKANISEHIRNIYEQNELEEHATVRNFRTVRQEGHRQVLRTLTYYNLDAIISIGFRVNSKRGIQFRQICSLSSITGPRIANHAEIQKAPASRPAL